MKKLTLLATAMLLALAGSGALVSAEPTPAPEAAAPAPPPPCTPAKQVYALKHWKRAHPARGRNVCAIGKRRLDVLKSRFADYRLYRHVATYHAPFGHGPPSPADGRWWAKPWPVICGESGGDWHPPSNPGDGGYQIIPSTWAAYGGTRFAPTAGSATPLEQHIIAHRAASAGEAWYGWKTDC